MPALVTALSWIAIGIALAGSIACWVYAHRCNNGDKAFFILAGIIQFYTVMIYALAMYTELYIIRSGVMTRLAAISYAGLWLSFVITRIRRRCG